MLLLAIGSTKTARDLNLSLRLWTGSSWSLDGMATATPRHYTRKGKAVAFPE